MHAAFCAAGGHKAPCELECLLKQGEWAAERTCVYVSAKDYAVKAALMYGFASHPPRRGEPLAHGGPLRSTAWRPWCWVCPSPLAAPRAGPTGDRAADPTSRRAPSAHARPRDRVETEETGQEAEAGIMARATPARCAKGKHRRLIWLMQARGGPVAPRQA